ncbi:MAG: MAPEG family protein, partial [Pseudomonadota bacterium]
MPVITSFYAALLTCLYLVLSARVILYRQNSRVSLGDDGDRQLLKRVRAQGNAAEYIPLGILLLALIELQGAPGIALHLLGLMLLVGRLLHGYALSGQPTGLFPRVAGMGLTLAMLGLS